MKNFLISNFIRFIGLIILLFKISIKEVKTNNFVRSNFKNNIIENYNYLDSNSTIGIQIIPNSLGINELDYYGVFYKIKTLSNLNNQVHILSNVNDLRRLYVFSLANLFKYDDDLFLNFSIIHKHSAIRDQISNLSSINYGLSLKVYKNSFLDLQVMDLFSVVKLKYLLISDSRIIEISYSIEDGYNSNLSLSYMHNFLDHLNIGLEVNSFPKSLSVKVQLNKDLLGLALNFNNLLDLGYKNEVIISYDH